MTIHQASSSMNPNDDRRDNVPRFLYHGRQLGRRVLYRDENRP
jgi:hypothetical protein